MGLEGGIQDGLAMGYKLGGFSPMNRAAPLSSLGAQSGHISNSPGAL
jgi:hypothetical protein